MENRIEDLSVSKQKLLEQISEVQDEIELSRHRKNSRSDSKGVSALLNQLTDLEETRQSNCRQEQHTPPNLNSTRRRSSLIVSKDQMLQLLHQHYEGKMPQTSLDDSDKKKP